MLFIYLNSLNLFLTGPLTSWKMVPIFRGIGLSMNIVNFYLVLYYNMIIAYSLYYLVVSFTSKLPWQECNPSWSNPSIIHKFLKFFVFLNISIRLRG